MEREIIVEPSVVLWKIGRKSSKSPSPYRSKKNLNDPNSNSFIADEKEAQMTNIFSARFWNKRREESARNRQRMQTLAKIWEAEGFEIIPSPEIAQCLYQCQITKDIVEKLSVRLHGIEQTLSTLQGGQAA